jgi:hypothetical protein
MEKIGIIYGHLEYITVIWGDIGNLLHFPRFGKLFQEKSGNPGKVRFPVS